MSSPSVAWRPVDGVLLVGKPSGITSTAALARARRALRAKKGGHTGTLDPLASGLLPLCFGEATKFASDLLDADKAYVATMRLGVTTDSGDAEGIVTATRPVDVDLLRVEAALAALRGPILQVPPMHSALKRDGTPLYELARRGIVVERAARAVTIHRLELRSLDAASLTIEVDCSKGTYVRVLAEEIGAALGCGAHLTALRRTRVGTLTLGDAVTLAEFEAAGEADREHRLWPVDALIRTLPRVELDHDDARRFVDGQRLPGHGTTEPGRVRVYRAAASPCAAPALLGTGVVDAEACLSPARLMTQRR